MGGRALLRLGVFGTPKCLIKIALGRASTGTRACSNSNTPARVYDKRRLPQTCSNATALPCFHSFNNRPRFCMLPRRGVHRGGGTAGAGGAAQGPWARFWAWTTRSGSEMPLPRFSVLWCREALLRCTVFAVTGTSSLLFMRPILRAALNEPTGSLVEGPNTYRAASLALLSPVYAVTLCVVGTASGRHIYFAKMASKILGRFLPPSARPRLLCAPARAKAGM